MDFISVFNDVIGPVMRGPSSSHTAGSHRIGRLARTLLQVKPRSVSFTFDPQGSYANVYRQQGVDLAFAAGIMGWELTDSRFLEALDYAAGSGIEIRFKVARLKGYSHPNTVAITAGSPDGKLFEAAACSIGGGQIEWINLNGWGISLSGKTHDILIECEAQFYDRICEQIKAEEYQPKQQASYKKEQKALIHWHSQSTVTPDQKERIKSWAGVSNVWICEPVFYRQLGPPLFNSAAEMSALAAAQSATLGQTVRLFEAKLLGMSIAEANDEMIRRYRIMKQSSDDGFNDSSVQMQLLPPSACKIGQSEAAGRLPVGGLHSRAAARAMAVMHVNNSMGVVCAAPTGGSAGVIPAVVVTLAEEMGLSTEQIALCLFAAGGIGLIIAIRATFAAEVAGCQVEIGAAGAMAAAAVAEAAGCSPATAIDAAAISLQNTMGSVCDLVQGMCEIPCHTRNAVAASSAFVCADLISGGYQNPIPLDETIDAVYSVGRMLPSELRCTAKGGLAVCPSAIALTSLK